MLLVISDNWVALADVKSRIVKEPIVTKLPGQPKKRIESNGEEPSQPKCSRCGQAGHNWKTCHSALPVRSTLSQSGNTSTRRRRMRTQKQYMYSIYLSMFQRQFTSVSIFV